MALKIRLQRGGAAHAPVYRIVVAESSSRRDGRFVEKLGHYNPSPRGADAERGLEVNLERADYWISVGAQPTNTADALLRKARRQKTTVAA
jgi:small subunit ribosomal protein S16